MSNDRNEGYSVISERQMVNLDSEPGEVLATVYSVVDFDGCTINYGDFLSESDANYVCKEMETGKYNGDFVSNLCKGMDSWISV